MDVLAPWQMQVTRTGLGEEATTQPPQEKRQAQRVMAEPCCERRQRTGRTDGPSGERVPGQGRADTKQTHNTMAGEHLGQIIG